MSNQNKKRFQIPVKDYVITQVGVPIKGITWIYLYILIEANKISFFLDMYPMMKTPLRYKAIIIDSLDGEMTELTTELPMGKPWGYADRKAQFASLPDNPECVIFWANELEVRIKNTYQFLPGIVEMLKRS